MSEVVGPSASEILDKIKSLATISPSDFTVAPEGQILSLFNEIYKDLIPETLTSINSQTLKDNAKESYLADNLETILDAVSMVRIPHTDIPLFLRGGSYSLFTDEGELAGFAEERVGKVYGTPEKPHNAAAFTVTKPAILFTLRALRLAQDINVQSNNDLICDVLGRPKGSVHMGGILVDLPQSKRGSIERKMVMGISSAEITPDALQYLKDKFIRNGAEHSIDPSGDDGHYTAAGFMDELAGRVAVSWLRMDSRDVGQSIVNRQWERLMEAAIPGPLPGQYH